MSDTATTTATPSLPGNAADALAQHEGKPDAGATETGKDNPEGTTIPEGGKPALTIDEPPPAEDTQPEAGGDIYAYNPTGDTGLDLALNYVGGLGFGPDHPAIKAAQNGDFSKLETVLSKMDNAKGYQSYMAVAKESYKRNTEAAAAATAESEKAVLAAAGGLENWNAIVAWAKKEGTPAELKQINAALNGGALSASSMAQTLAAQFKASGHAKNNKSALKSGAGGGAPSGVQPLPPGDYIKEVAKLSNKHGYANYRNTDEYQSLVQRRKAFNG